jgi:hypothetical protein
VQLLSTLMAGCLETVEAHNRIGEGVAGRAWFNEDVELGRCVSRNVGIQCSNSEEVSNIITHHKIYLYSKTHLFLRRHKVSEVSSFPYKGFHCHQNDTVSLSSTPFIRII